MTPGKCIERLSLYRRILVRLKEGDERYVFSHRLAELAGGTAAQVRRDIMTTGYTGTPKQGYVVGELLDCLNALLDGPGPQHVALVGVGNLGRALLAYFTGRRPHSQILAAFDANPDRVERVINGCRCYPAEEMERVVRELGITLGIITVPAPAAQAVADKMYAAGIRGVLNFAPAVLTVPGDMYVESMDVTMALEKVAYFGRHGSGRE